jgi:hypothetical protein
MRKEQRSPLSVATPSSATFARSSITLRFPGTFDPTAIHAECAEFRRHLRDQ